MSRTVAIAYANLKGNLGDFAILQSMLMDIRRSRPDCLPHVYSQPFVPVDEQRLEAFKRLAPPFEYMGTMREDLRHLTPLQVRALRMVSALRVYQEARTSRLAEKAAMDFGPRFAEYDAIYLAGGAQWTGVNAGVSMFANLRAMARYNTEIYTYPISVSSSVQSLNLKASLLSDFGKIRKPLIARDSETHAMLCGLGLDATLGADCVFALASLFGERRTKNSANNRLLFVLTNQATETIEKALNVAKAAGFSPALLSTCAVEDGAAQVAAAERAGVPFIAPLTWQEAVAEMEASAIVLTNRLHGLILSSFSSACVVPLTDRQKVRAVVQDAELPVSVGSLAELDGSKLDEAGKLRDEIKTRLRTYREKTRDLTWSPIPFGAS